MTCGPIAQIFNLVALVLLIGCTVANQWSNITSLTFDTSSVGAMSQTVGCLTSVVALVLFPVLWLTEAELMAWASTLLAVVDCVCYGIWSFLGTTSSLCSGAESTASDLGVDLSSYLQCDAQWMQYLLWGLVCVSGSLQPSVATSAIGGGGGSANELGRKRRRGTSSVTSPAVSYAPPAAQPGTSTVARSLGRKQSRSSRRPKRETKAREVEDEEAELPLQREEYGRVVEERSEEWSSEERDGRAEYGEGRRKEKGRSSKWSAA